MIRRSGEADAEAVAWLVRRAVRLAYADVVDPARLAEEPDVGLWAARFRDSGAIEHWVWEQDGRIAAMAAAGPADDADLDSQEVGCLFGLYVDPVAQGAGLGRTLHDHALGALDERGARQAVLWVLEGNGRAREFYARLGWRQEPAVRETDETWDVPIVRYRRAL